MNSILLIVIGIGLALYPILFVMIPKLYDKEVSWDDKKWRLREAATLILSMGMDLVKCAVYLGIFAWWNCSVLQASIPLVGKAILIGFILPLEILWVRNYLIRR